ncbi:methyltransferase domain-containing protein [Streptomyces sp. GbtcB6]|uniref:methyltransferase domain-containing protein n=1 Tax=Streptomyces sp. GbtcB6 TaxID=2824751 RepID=UPI001C310BD5|nr:methyltransferase domain-containing protein [Streptomyces sp. GbtcB6]
MAETTYLMEDPREAERLAAKVDPAAWVDRYLARRLRPGDRVLDIGCGPGVIARQVADTRPGVHVTGVDFSPSRITEARARLAGVGAAVRSDARELPLPDASFDLVYCRFMLQFLPDPQRALAEMVRVCRPGGLILLQELDGQLLWHHPEDPELQAGLETVVKGLERSGFDPFIGRKLFHFAHRAGLRDVEVAADSYHLIAGRADEETMRLWRLKLEIAQPARTEALGDADAAQRVQDRFLEYLAREDTLTYSVAFTVVGRR